MHADATIRSATLGDVPALHGLIQAFAERNFLLSRTTGELYETIRDFLVAENADQLLGCSALHIVNARIAELKSLAVSEDAQGMGLGRRLVAATLDEARAIGLQRVFCLTYQEAFFGRCGFVKVDRSRLPEKVWGECVRCNKFLDCDEVAMWVDLQASK
ncbi:MAG: N-acetyltransferase [Planctomycetota bacterium]|jgi:amino-acid N-acetyltransferase|nr:N-acetyltransferase [Planctomycetota bacterium]